MCIRDRNYAFNVAYADYIPIREVHGPFFTPPLFTIMTHEINVNQFQGNLFIPADTHASDEAVSYTHLRAHETVLDLVCRLLLEKKKNMTQIIDYLFLIHNT